MIDPVTGEDLEELELQRLKTALRDAEAVRRMLVERMLRVTDELEAQVKRLQKAKGRK